MKVVVISASPRKEGNTQIMMRHVHDHAKRIGGADYETVLINPADGGIECFRGHGEQYNAATIKAADDIMSADVWLIGTPIYNSLFSSSLKNLFEYVDYKKTQGKTAGIAILAAGQTGFIDVQTVVTQLMSYFRVVTNPKAVFMTVDEIADGRVADAGARGRLEEMVEGTLSLASRLSGRQS